MPRECPIKMLLERHFPTSRDERSNKSQVVDICFQLLDRWLRWGGQRPVASAGRNGGDVGQRCQRAGERAKISHFSVVAPEVPGGRPVCRRRLAAPLAADNAHHATRCPPIPMIGFWKSVGGHFTGFGDFKGPSSKQNKKTKRLGRGGGAPPREEGKQHA